MVNSHIQRNLKVFATRWYSTQMKCFQIDQYAPSVDQLKYQLKSSFPGDKFIKSDEALVRIHAASINPFDIEMSRGYGRNAINLVRKYANSNEFPLILGRDFSGVIIKSGRLFKRFKKGDPVYGVRWVSGQGTHAEYVVVKKTEISPKPNNLTHVEAASLPYVACTTWSALINSGAVPIRGSQKLKIFVPGVTGGIGSFASQLCKAYGHNITASCSTNGINKVKRIISIDDVIDYTNIDYEQDLRNAGPFDVILDTQNEKYIDLYKKMMKDSLKSKYVSLRPTLLPDTDSKGIPIGLLNAGIRYIGNSFDQLNSGKGQYHWGFFSPDGMILDRIKNLVENGSIKPFIDRVFSIDDIVEAYKHVEKGHSRGKTIIKMVDEE